MDHPITGGRILISKIVAIPPTSAEAPDPADRFRFRFHIPVLYLREWTRQSLSEISMDAGIKEKKIANYFFFIYLTLKNRLDIVYLRVKPPWMQKQNKRANERSGAREQSDQCEASEWVSNASERASGRANDRVLYASTSYHFNPERIDLRLFLWAWLSVFFTIWGWHSFPLKPDVRKEIED